MKIEELLTMKKPTIEDFLKLENPQEYDFSNVCFMVEEDSEIKYKEIDDKIYNFFIYMMNDKEVDFRKYDGDDELFINAKEKVIEELKKIGPVIKHPDSNSPLLQEIYKKLWNVKKYLNKYDNETISGETLNSVLTTLINLYKIMEKSGKYNKELYERNHLQRNQAVSIMFITSKYLTQYKFENEFKDKNGIIREHEIIKNILENKHFEKLVKSYHTLGNFMPFPDDCNGPRGIGSLKDYFDLTLLHIYNYYNDKNKPRNIDEIVKIVGENHKDVFKKWLDSFDDTNNIWHDFIEKNYLEFFVEEKNGEKYYPKELWEGHFNDKASVAPTTEEQCIDYFKNASDWINKRGIYMLGELINKSSSK